MQWKHENIEESGECSGNMRMQRNQENVCQIQTCSGNLRMVWRQENVGKPEIVVKQENVLVKVELSVIR